MVVVEWDKSKKVFLSPSLMDSNALPSLIPQKEKRKKRKEKREKKKRKGSYAKKKDRLGFVPE